MTIPRRALMAGGLALLAARSTGFAAGAGKPVVTVYKSPT